MTPFGADTPGTDGEGTSAHAALALEHAQADRWIQAARGAQAADACAEGRSSSQALARTTMQPAGELPTTEAVWSCQRRRWQ